jgi:hypothetical protein
MEIEEGKVVSAYCNEIEERDNHFYSGCYNMVSGDIL